MESNVPAKEFESWGIEEVGAWLEKTVSLPQYKPIFADLAIDGSLLQHIMDEDLVNDFEIRIRLHRIKIIKAIEKLNTEHTRKIEDEFANRVNIDEDEEVKHIPTSKIYYIVTIAVIYTFDWELLFLWLFKLNVLLERFKLYPTDFKV